MRPSLKIGDRDMRLGKAFRYTVDVPGQASIELIGLNGARMGTIVRGFAAAGPHEVQWNGKTLEGAVVGGAIAVARLSSLGGIVSRIVYIGK